MKSCLMIISLILSSFMIHEAQGMSLRRGSSTLPDKNDIHQRIVPSKRSNDGTEEDEGPAINHQVKKFSGTKNRKLLSTTDLSKKPYAHWLPRFHEDYYGPRFHSPKHH